MTGVYNMDLEESKNLAIFIVDDRLKTGNCYAHTLLKYVPNNYWDTYLSIETEDLIIENITDFNYSRCFHYYFIEDIELQHPFFSKEADDEIIARGYVEFISLRISAIAPFYSIEKAMYNGNEIPLNLTKLSEFQNRDLEKHFISIKKVMRDNNIHEVNVNQLDGILADVELEDYEQGEARYKNYLFE